MGRESGLASVEVCDITSRTVPTYPALRRLLKMNPAERFVIWWGLSGMEVLARLDLLQYVILTFSRPSEAPKSEPVLMPNIAGGLGLVSI